AAAVILPADEKLLYLNDSKKLSEKKREELYDIIMDRAVAVGIGSVSHTRIDEINILQATYEAMTEAVKNLSVKPGALLIDAVHIPQLEEFKQISIIKGDAKSASIAAASIVAKVTRDRVMKELSSKYPEYSFDKNKGYGSEAHIEAIRKCGPCEIHRRSFIGNFI
ncbi:MAG: ribonuclease HII, partial [Lachnospiraceae bacterium]|nr:ribonuclease HII [Lachnospiraceae bacterium]